MAEALSDAGFDLYVSARRAHSSDAISRVSCLRHESLKSLAVMVSGAAYRGQERVLGDSSYTSAW
jgi:hypothetical protein